MAEDRRGRRDVDSSLRNVQVWDSVLALVGDLHPAHTDQSDNARRPTDSLRLRVLDIGGGTGGLAVPLARQGHDVLVVDPSPDALAALERRSAEAGVGERVSAVQGDTATLASLCPAGSIDLVCCHGVLEFVDDPTAALDALCATLAPGGGLSLLVANRMAAVLARAVAGRVDQARQVLASDEGRWGDGDPLPRRFYPDQVRQLVTDAGLEIVAEHGVRVLADLVPAAATESPLEREHLLELERAIGRDPAAAALAHVASAWHVLARRSS